jgi:hypothetical protein
MGEGFLDHQCGIAAAGTVPPGRSATRRVAAGPCGYLTSFSSGRRNGPCGDFDACELPTAASSGAMASHSLQFEAGHPVELHPKLENGHRHQQRSVAVAARDECGPALFEGCKNRMQSSF